MKTLQKFAWPGLAIVFVIALASGSFAARPQPMTQQARIDRLASQIRCPTCEGLSVQQSVSPLAESSKQEITNEVQAGKTDKQIRDYFVSRYGPTALMSPKRTGIVNLAWILPVLVGIALIAGVVLAIRKWGIGRGTPGPTATERRRVEIALEHVPGETAR